jgi:hypothetical protein
VDRTEKVNELMARAERLGLRLEFDSGLLIVSRTATADPERQWGVVEELGKYLPEVRTFLERRAIFVRANQLLNQPVWSPEFGQGQVESAESNGRLCASFQRDGSQRATTLGVSADSLFLILEKEGATPTPLEDQAKSDKPQKGFFGQLLRRVGEN